VERRPARPRNALRTASQRGVDPIEMLVRLVRALDAATVSPLA